MSNDQSSPRRAESFFDRFLQEQNIQWMLGIGAAILLASSLMLVTTHWNEASYTPFWKYLTLVGYCVVVFAGSQWSYFRAGLRKTGTMLMALSVLLVPISFLALRLVHGEENVDVGWLAADLVALGINVALSIWIATRVFGHFLRSAQPTFTACFLLLSVAGAILPGVSSHTSPFVTGMIGLLLWTLFAVGTVKVNRHVFWLVEERRAPRIFGFFPILLLGSQFLMLFVLHCAGQIADPWRGLGCVLTAIPILLTVDTLARIFQQRTGNLVRPLPWSIALPLFAALLFCVAGVGLAGAGLRLPEYIPTAFVPTLALAAVIAGIVARRTNQQALVWMMLGLLTLAYNFSYVFFRSTVAFLLQQGAAAVHEARLPMAFYGLTYLPLLLTLIVAAYVTQRRGNLLFSRPMRAFCTLLPLVLLVASCTHIKALFPVGMVMVVLFGLQTVLFGDRRILLPAIGAWFIAALGAVPFAVRVLEMHVPAGAGLMWVSIATGLLLFPGHLIDRWAGRLSKASAESLKLGVDPFQRASFRPCQLASCLATLILAVAWTINFALLLDGTRGWPAAAVIGGLIVAHSLRRMRPELGTVAYAFMALVAGCVAVTFDLTVSQIMSSAIVVLLAQWLAGYPLQKYSASRVSRTFAPVLKATSRYGLTCALVGICLPSLILRTVGEVNFLSEISLTWPCQLLLIAWSFIAARQFCQPRLAYLGCFAVLGTISASLASPGLDATYEWVLPAWALTALVGLAIVEVVRSMAGSSDNAERERANEALLTPIDRTAFGLQIVAAFVSLTFFDLPMKLAAAMSVTGLLITGIRRRQPGLKTVALAVGNWQLLTLVVPIFCPGVTMAVQFGIAEAIAISVPLALAAAVSQFIWQRWPQDASDEVKDLGAVQRMLLQFTTAVALGVSLLHSELSLLAGATAGATFLLLATSKFWTACQRRQVDRVWAGLTILALGVGYFILVGWIPLHTGKGMFFVLGTGLMLWGLSRLAVRRPFTEILSTPLEQTAMVMPMLAVMWGVARHFHYPDPQRLRMNSLGLLIAAAFYFWRGMEERRNQWWLLSAGIVNVALVLLWRELQFSDPQFYMIPVGATIVMLVQLLKRDIPAAWHDPLRYLGALVILVSPTFDIVGGSWPHLVALMVASVVVAVVAIGLHIRALLYTGTAFLAADLVAIVVLGSINNPNLLWIAGLGVGAAVVGLAAVCENNREKLQQRLRMVSAALAQWD